MQAQDSLSGGAGTETYPRGGKGRLRGFASSWVASMLLLFAMPAVGQEDNSQRGLLRAYGAWVAEQCPRLASNVEDARAKGDQNKALMMGQMHHMICTCQPRKINARLQSLSDAEAARPLDNDSFTAMAAEHLIGPCTHEFMTELLSGATCEKLQAGRGAATAANFCGCMKPELRRFTNAEAMEIGTRFATYIPAARKAKAEGRELPDRTPLMDRLVTTIEKCGDFVFLAK